MMKVSTLAALAGIVAATAACAPTPGPAELGSLIAVDPTVENTVQRAEDGDPVAQRTLADRYYRGVDDIAFENFERAAYWYNAAAAQGDIQSQRMMGELYREGRGVPQDRAEAFTWYERAAQRGDAVSQYWTGVALSDWNDAVNRDPVAAFTWLELAARSYDSIAGPAAEARDRVAGDLDGQDLTWARLMAREFSPAQT